MIRDPVNQNWKCNSEIGKGNLFKHESRPLFADGILLIRRSKIGGLILEYIYNNGLFITGIIPDVHVDYLITHGYLSKMTWTDIFSCFFPLSRL